MSYHQQVKFSFFCLIFIFSQTSFASEKHLLYPKLVMHGETYENSCSTKQRRDLTRNIRKNIQYDSRSLQSTIELILCGNYTAQNTKRMINIVDEVVTTSYDGTGEEKIVGSSKDKMAILKDVMAEGKAWHATLIFDDSEVKLQYFSSEACVESVKLRHANNSWVIHEIGGACD